MQQRRSRSSARSAQATNTLELTAKEKVNRVPQRVLASGWVDLTDQLDGQLSIILAWARYAAAANDPGFVSATYEQVASLMDASLDAVHFDPAFGLARNPHLEHYRQGKMWNTYDFLTESYAAETLKEMSGIAQRRADAAHAQRWEDDEILLSEAIAKGMEMNFDGQPVYAEMFQDNSTTRFYPGLSEFSFGPTAAGWAGVDPTRYDDTITTLMRYASFDWQGNRVIGVGFTKDEDPFPYTSGKSLAWQLLYFAQRADWKQVEQTLSFIQAEQRYNGQRRIYESSLPLASSVITTDPGNGEQTVWMLCALHALQKMSGAAP